MAAPAQIVNLERSLARFSDQWSPKIVAEANDWHVKLVKASGRFVSHRHDVDELFLVLTGALAIELGDGTVQTVGAGELYVVPAGREHLPDAGFGCTMLLLEPAGVPNTGDAGGARTADDAWL